MHRSVLGEGEKYDKERDHMSHGRDTGIRPEGDSKDFSEDLNKSKYKNDKKTAAGGIKYKNDKKTTVGGNQWENK